jgi:hypothetical protein
LQLEEFLYRGLTQVVPIRNVICYSLAYAHTNGRTNQTIVTLGTDLPHPKTGMVISLYWPYPSGTAPEAILSDILTYLMDFNHDIYRYREESWKKFAQENPNWFERMVEEVQ